MNKIKLTAQFKTLYDLILIGSHWVPDCLLVLLDYCVVNLACHLYIT